VSHSARRALLELVADELRQELGRLPGPDADGVATIAGLVDDLVELAGAGIDQSEVDDAGPFDAIYRTAAG
jgi:hypothetical protein